MSAGVCLSPCCGGGENLALGSIDELFRDSVILWAHRVFLLSELDEVFEKVIQGASMSHQQQRVSDTTDTSGEDTDVEQPRKRLRSRRTFKMKKGYAVGEVAQFFVTGSTDAAN